MSRFTLGKYRDNVMRMFWKCGPDMASRKRNFLCDRYFFRSFPTDWPPCHGHSHHEWKFSTAKSNPEEVRTKKRKRAPPCKREHVTIRSHRGPRRDSIRWFPSPNSAAGALADPTLQSFPGNDCHYRAREGERERVDEPSRGIGLHCDCVSVWSHWPTNCDYGRVCSSTDAGDLHRRGWWWLSNSPFLDDLHLIGIDRNRGLRLLSRKYFSGRDSSRWRLCLSIFAAREEKIEPVLRFLRSTGGKFWLKSRELILAKCYQCGCSL